MDTGHQEYVLGVLSGIIGLAPPATAQANEDRYVALLGILGLVVMVGGWALVMGGIGHFCGKRKDNARAGFYLGFLLGPIGWIIAALLDYPLKCPECKSGVPRGAFVCKNCGYAPNRQKKCPFCAELILREAIKCRFCGSDLMEQGASASQPTPPPEPATPAMASCKCNACSGEIQFNADGFDYRNPPTVSCPHCGQDTLLYIPTAAQETSP
jgi:hypothetical protein